METSQKKEVIATTGKDGASVIRSKGDGHSYNNLSNLPEF